MNLFKKKKSRKRACLIGLDGVPFSLLNELAEKGILEETSKIIKSGYLHRMKASLPEISAVSWTDFMTGSNPGSHGIFGFTDFKKNSYDLRFPSFLDLKKETFWDKLGRENKRCIIINQPSTYPARKINGVLISGFVALDLSKAVYPLSLKPELEKIGYQIDIDTFRSREDHEFLWKDLEKTLQARFKAWELLWGEDWDYFEFVITGTDRLHHFLWNAYQDEKHPYHQNFLNYYKKIDEIVGKIVKEYENLSKNNHGLFLISDHGFTEIEQEVYLNAWFEKEGFLHYEKPAPNELKEISSKTKAFVMEPNRIYINLKRKFPKGCVEEEEKEELKKEIRERLEKLDYGGKRVVRKVFDVEEIYSGPHVAEGPDLIVLSEYGFDIKASVKKREIFGRSNLQGMHTWDDAFFWSIEDYGENLFISDVAQFILESMK